jgi:hypothetical protein
MTDIVEWPVSLAQARERIIALEAEIDRLRARVTTLEGMLGEANIAVPEGP